MKKNLREAMVATLVTTMTMTMDAYGSSSKTETAAAITEALGGARVIEVAGRG